MGEARECADEGEDGEVQGGWGGDESAGEEVSEETSEATCSICGCEGVGFKCGCEIWV